MRESITIDLFNGETVRMIPTGEAVRGELLREGRVVASASFASETAARRWADAVIARAARSSPRAICANCED